MCQKFNCLPTGGGLLDQDSVLVRAMTLTMNAFGEAEEKKLEEIRAKRGKH
jgi:hypothetical protein